MWRIHNPSYIISSHAILDFCISKKNKKKIKKNIKVIKFFKHALFFLMEVRAQWGGGNRRILLYNVLSWRNAVNDFTGLPDDCCHIKMCVSATVQGDWCNWLKYIVIPIHNSYRNSQQDATVYQNLLFHVYMKLSVFQATHRPSSGAQNCTSSLWFCIRERLLDVEVAGRCQHPATSTSNNLSHMQNQGLLVQFWAPDDGRFVARNMLSFV